MISAQTGTVFAAFFAAMLTMFGIIVVRGTKISEFRQKWIDEQRQDISLLLATAARLAADPSARRDDHLLTFDITANRVRLREKPKEPEWTDVLQSVDEIRLKLGSMPPRQIDISAEEAAIVAAARVRLKIEWKRVSRGEMGYRIFYFFAVALASLVVLSLFAGFAAHQMGYVVPIDWVAPSATGCVPSSASPSPTRSPL